MIGISKLYCGTVEPSDALRYGRESGKLPSHLLQFSADKKPVVVWNVTRRCNLKCVHCYAHARDEEFSGELSTDEGKAVLDDLAAFGAPVVLFSGGEPLIRPDLTELAAYAVEKGMRAVISSNGTLIDARLASELRKIGLSYVGISLDGLEAVNDRFRGIKGAFGKALDGIIACREAGIKVGLRFTMNRLNAREIPGIFDLLEKHDIPRVCFYHLVYAGRGSGLMKEDLSHEDPRGGRPHHGSNGRSARPRPRKGSPHRGQPRRRPLSLPPDGPRGFAQSGGGPQASGNERGKQFRTRNRVHQLGRKCARGPVLAALFFRERPGTQFQQDLDRSLTPAHEAAQRQEAPRKGPVRGMHMARCVRR